MTTPTALRHLATLRPRWPDWTWLHDIDAPRLAATAVLFALATAASFLAQDFEKPVTAALVYVLGVTLIGATQGPMLALISALLAAAIYNFAIAEPAFVFRFAGLDDFVPLVAFSICALTSGVLAGRLKSKAQQSQRSAEELLSLLEISKAFQRAVTPSDLPDLIALFEPSKHNIEVVLYARQNDEMELIASTVHEPTEPALRELAHETMRRRAPVGDGGGWTAYPLIGAEGAFGALLVRLRDHPQPRATRAAIDAFVNMVGLTLERCLLHERLATSRAIERSEAFKTTLLSSVSHDMRTPLTTISASVSGLIDYGDSLSRDTQLQLLGAIREQCDRLNRYTANLLNLSRLQSGIDVGRLPVIDLIDVIGGATNAIRPRLGTRTIHKALEINSLLVKADPILLEQVLLNILENAVAYSPDGSAIKIRLTREPGHARLEVVDQGIGIPPAELERVFERFHRVEQHRGQTAGSGLGLAIAKGFVEAIGGTIHAQSPSKDGAGTAIIIRLKLAETHP